MGTSLDFRAVLRRAGILFAASLAVAVLFAALLAWHHARMVPPCPDPAQAGGAVSCYVRAWHFGPSPGVLAALLLLDLGFCMLVACVWSLARRR
ncbi:MAG TPA: hypothetical protein VFH59_12440 [Frateuria sp.]|uniref:hypothetical protein n=1 Tax=Frateuria sp. TaxID=2211372 RepID=UPI002D801EA2|nr:hypothetical protein [Frateuria sp.]HET6806239.1 hypothetical protein [Frateuria sp.]